MVSFGQYVLGGEQELLDRGGHTALQEDRLLGPASRLEQGRVLHVAGTDLDDVRDLGNVAQAFRVHGFGADQEARFLARLGEQLESRPAQPLERVGRCARLPGPAAQDHGARVLHQAGRLDDLPLAFDGAGPSDRHDLGAADRHAAGEPDDRILGLPFAAHLFVRLGDVDDVLHAGKAFEPRRVHPPVVANQAHGGALRTGHGSRFVAHLLNHGDDATDFVLARAMSHDDQHYLPPPPMVNRSPSLAAVIRPVNRAPAARAGSEVSTGG